MELILEFNTFELVKYLNKFFFDSFFVTKFRNLLKNKIHALDDKQMMHLNFDKARLICTTTNKITQTHNPEELLDIIFLNKLVHSSIKEQQIHAINSLNSLLESGNLNIQFLLSQNFLEHILELSDPDIYVNSENILRSAAEYLTFSQLELIFSYINRNSIGVPCVNFLCDICTSLNPNYVKQFFSLFHSYTDAEVTLATELCLKSIQYFDFLIEEYPLIYLNHLLCDQYSDFHTLAIKTLSKIFSHFSLLPKVEQEICKLIKDIKSNIRTVQSIRLILQINFFGFRMKNLLTEGTIKKLIENIVVNTHLEYADEVKEKIKWMLELIELFIRMNKNIDKKSLEDLFDSIIYTNYDDIFADWFEKCIGNLPPGLTTELFNKYFFQNPAYEFMTIHSFRCFYKMFLVINSYERRIELKQGMFQVRLQGNLLYLNNLIDLALYSKDSIFQDCLRTLVSLNVKLPEGLMKSKMQIWDSFFNYLLEKSDKITNPRILSLILGFLEPPHSDNEGYPMLFLFKTLEETCYSQIYIEENAILRDLKDQLLKHYKKKQKSLIIRASGIIYERFDDDIKVKSIKSNKLIVEFEDDKYENLGISDYLCKSMIIQKYLLEMLSNNEDYSKIALQILELVPINNEINKSLINYPKSYIQSYETNNESIHISSILPQSYYSFLYYCKVIEKLIIDQSWLDGFTKTSSFLYILSHYCTLSTDEVKFCMNFLTLTEAFVQKSPEILNPEIVRKAFLAVERISLENCEEGPAMAEKFYYFLSGIGLNKEEILEGIVNDEDLFKGFLGKCIFVCKSRLFCQFISNGIVELCKKNEGFLIGAVNCLVELLENARFQDVNKSAFILIRKLLDICEKPQIYVERIIGLAREVFEIDNRTWAKGILICVLGVEKFLDNKFIMFLIEKLYFRENSVAVSRTVRIYLKDILIRTCTLYEEYKKIILEKYTEAFKILEWRGSTIKDWSYSTNYLKLHDFSYIKFAKNPKLKALTPILYIFTLIPSLNKQIISLPKSQQVTFASLLQKTLIKIQSNFSQSVNTVKITDFLIDQEKNILDLTLNKLFKLLICKLVQNFADQGNKSHLIFQGRYYSEYMGKKECKHIERYENTFNYFKIPVKSQKVGDYLKSMFKYESIHTEKKHNCGKCGNKVFANKKKVYKRLPSLLFLMLKRFEKDSNYGTLKNDSFCEFPEILDMQSPGKCSSSGGCFYKLIGIISQKGSGKWSSYSTYVNLQDGWAEFSEDETKLSRPKSFIKELYGKTLLRQAKDTDKTACILFYELISDRNQQPEEISDLVLGRLSSFENFSCPLSLSRVKNPHDEFLVKLMLTCEFLEFAQFLLINPSSDTLYFCIRYLFFFVLRLNSKELIENFFSTLKPALQIDAKVSEGLLDLIKNNFISSELLLDCPVIYKSEIVVKILNICVLNSRPSAYLKFLSVLLNKLPSVQSHNNESFFEIIYMICKLNPILAAEEGAIGQIMKVFEGKAIEQYLDSSEDHKLVLQNYVRSIPNFLIASLSVFQDKLQEDNSKILRQDLIESIIINAKHSKITAMSSGKLYYEVYKNYHEIINPYLKTLVKAAFDEKDLRSKNYFFQLSAYLRCCKKVNEIVEIINLVTGKIKGRYHVSYVFAQLFVDCIFYAVFYNDNVMSVVKCDKELLKIIEEMLKIKPKNKEEAVFGSFEFSFDEKNDMFAKIKCKKNIWSRTQSARVMSDHMDICDINQKPVVAQGVRFTMN